MNTCINMENILSYLSGTMAAELTDEFYAHLAVCKKCRNLFVESEAVLHECKDLQWAVLPFAEAQKFLDDLTPKTKLSKIKDNIIPMFKEWITEKWSKTSDSILNTDPCLIPITNEWNERRLRDNRNNDCINYRLLSIDTPQVIARLFFECESMQPFSFGIKVLDVKYPKVANEDMISSRFTLWNKHRTFTNPVKENTVLKTGLSGGTYHFSIKYNAQEIFQFDFIINEKGIVYENTI